MDNFAFIIHPIDPKRDIGRKYPFLARIVNDWIIYHVAPLFPPVYLSEVEGICSASTGKRIKGWLIACPLTPSHFFQLPEIQVYRKIIETGRLAEKLGAKILGLGAFTSVVGDGGISVANALDIPVTTGDSYTVAIAVQSLRKAANSLDIRWEAATAAVIGATGAIGRACSALLARDVAEMYLVGRRVTDLEALRDELTAKGAKAYLHISTDMQVLRQAHLVIGASSSLQAIVEPDHLRPGSVVCDIARPRDVSEAVAAVRPDILVIDGGMVEVPGPADFHFNFGLPPGKAYACMAETIALALEGRLESFTLGKQISSVRVEEIAGIAEKHGFMLSDFRSFDRLVTEEQIEYVRRSARLS